MSSLSKLDLNLLVVFEAIYSAGNISRAATALGLTQPTISNSLTRLRETLDDQLFVRSGRGIAPTPKAIQIIEPIRDILRVVQSEIVGRDQFDPTVHRRHFRMVMLDTVELIIIPHILKTVQHLRTITIETSHMVTAPPMERLTDGSIDLVVAPFIPGPSELACKEVQSFRLSVIARKNHPAIRGPLSLDHFCTVSAIALPARLRAMSLIDEALRRQGIERHIAYTADKIWSFPAIVANSDLLGVVPDTFASIAARYFSIDIHPMPVDVPEQKLYMTWKKNRSDDLGLAWLRGQVVEALAEHCLDPDIFALNDSPVAEPDARSPRDLSMEDYR